MAWGVGRDGRVLSRAGVVSANLNAPHWAGHTERLGATPNARRDRSVRPLAVAQGSTAPY
eukprot:246791-Prymnesium_polylepis.1